jgi:hypothetical protein
MLLERALGDDPPPADPGKVMPPRRALILHRLAAAAAHRPGRHGEPRELSGFAAGLRAVQDKP